MMGEIRLLAVQCPKSLAYSPRRELTNCRHCIIKLIGDFENDVTLSVTPKAGSQSRQRSSEMRHWQASVIYRSHSMTKLHAGPGTSRVTWPRKNV